MRLALALVASALVLTACASGGAAGSDDSEKLARDYVEAINARDGERVCGLMTKAAADELSAPDGSLSCDQAVAGFIGYDEDAGMPEFLQYQLEGVRPGATQGEYSSIRMSLEGRRRASDSAQAFETCSFEDTVWLTRDGGEFRIAKPSVALYFAFGATNVPDEAWAPPGADTGASNGEQVFDCTPEEGEQPDADAPAQSPAGLAAQLDQESEVSDVRCFEAEASDGWDVICTYFDTRLGERMKSGYRWGPNSTVMSGGSVPAGSSLPPAP